MFTFLLQIMVVVIMIAAATFAFYVSSVFSDLVSFLSDTIHFDSTITLIVVIAILLCSGLLMLFSKKEPANGAFTAINILFCLPSLIVYSSNNWFGLLGWRNDINTQLTLFQLYFIISIIIMGYVALSFIAWFRKSGTNLERLGHDINQLKEIQDGERIWGLLVLLAATVITIIIGLLSHATVPICDSYIRSTPANGLIIGVIFCLLIIGAIYSVIKRYWISNRQRQTEEPVEGSKGAED